MVGVDGAVGVGLANLPVGNHEGVPGSRQGTSAPASQWTVTPRVSAHLIPNSITPSRAMEHPNDASIIHDDKHATCNNNAKNGFLVIFYEKGRSNQSRGT